MDFLRWLPSYWHFPVSPTVSYQLVLVSALEASSVTLIPDLDGTFTIPAETKSQDREVVRDLGVLWPSLKA